MKNSLSLFTLIILSALHLSAQDWNLVWSDEFDGTALNTANWTYETGTGSAQGLTGWGNNELQYYRSGTNNVSVSDGVLSIIAKEESFAGSDYTSARIKTAGLQAWNQGKIEARIKLPIGQGIWPAFWMLREDPFSDPNAQYSWPGEIDVVETIGHQPSIVYGTAHYGVPSSVLSNGGNFTLQSGTVSSDYHTYSIEWYEELIVWKLDGIQYHTLHINDVSPDYWLFNQEYFALLNVAVGGNWPGSPDASTVFPVQMDVDYVRVYELISSVVSVTFNVDMRCETDFSAVGLEGPSSELGNWCGGCVPLTDFDQDGIWTVTLELPPGDLEYKYSIDNFDGQENLVDDMQEEGTCAPITDFNSYANRLVTLSEGAVYDDTYGSCEACDPDNVLGCTDMGANNYDPGAVDDDGSCMYDVTFNVDMNCYDGSDVNIDHDGAGGPSNGSFITPAVEGPGFGWCGSCVQMEDPDADGIWSIIVELPAGPFEYKYAHDTFAGQEQLVDDVQNGTGACAPITDGSVYANRSVTVETGATTNDTYGSCFDCIPGAGCMDPDAVNYDPSATLDNGSCAYAVTFVLDMNNVDPPFTTPEVNGVFNDWCGSCNPMTDEDSNDIWTTTINILNGMTEFKFSTDDQSNEEALALDLDCVVLDEGNINRALNVTGNMTYGPAAWEACPACPGDLNGDGMINTTDFITFNAVFGNSCTDCPSDMNNDGEVNVADFIIFNSLFGTSCY